MTVVAAVTFLAVAVLVLPAYLAPRSAFDNDGDAVRAQNDARGMMLQGLGGLVLLLGAYVTWRQYQVNREAMQDNLRATAAHLKAAQDQLVIAQEGQITERFTRAVDQLGSDQLVVRLGGIYALERIAMNSPRDAATIAEVLSSYIRQHAPWPADGNLHRCWSGAMWQGQDSNLCRQCRRFYRSHRRHLAGPVPSLPGPDHRS